MFRRLMNYLSTSVGGIASKYALRASVAVPFLLAGGFLIAGAAVWLIELFGYRIAYFLMAAAFTLIGLVAIGVVRWHEANEEAEAEKERETSTLLGVAAEAAVRVPAAMSSTSAQPSVVNRAAAFAKANWPLLIVLIGLLSLAANPRNSRANY
jgi:hypothetical protein